MKQNRHQKIAELVSRYEIETQEELAQNGDFVSTASR